MGRHNEDLTGRRYGRLVVIGDGTDRYEVMCKCDCGKVKSINKFSLKEGKTKSCGCLQKEMASELGRHNSEIGLFNKHYEIMRRFHTSIGMLKSNKIRKNNKTGYTGVHFNHRTGKYEAYISISGKKKHLGAFESVGEAAMAREEAVEQYYEPLIECIQEAIV